MALYRNIIKGAWRSTFKNKYLWFFGLFAVLLGNGGEYEIFFRSFSSGQDSESLWATFIGQLSANIGSFSNIGKRLWENPSLTFVILVTYLFILAVFLFVFWMMNVSEVAIVNATAREVRGKEHTLKIGLQKGIKHFWPVFFLNLLIKSLIMLSLTLLAISKGGIIYVVLFLIVIPLTIGVLFIIKYAIAYIVVRKEKFLSALVSAWQLFKENWIISLELAAILYMFTILAGLLFMFLSFNIIMFFHVLARATFSSGSGLSFIILYNIMPGVLFMTLAFVGSLLSVFQIESWTKLFLELDNKGARSKIERVFSK